MALAAFGAVVLVVLSFALRNPLFRITSRAGGHPTTVTLFRSIVGGISVSQDNSQTTYSDQPVNTVITRIAWVDPISMSNFQIDLKKENFQKRPFNHPLDCWGGSDCDYLLITEWKRGTPYLIKREFGTGDLEPLLQKFYKTCGVKYRYHSPA